MLIPDVLSKMALYVSVVLLMPGPTNTLLFTSGLEVGVRRTFPLVMAEMLGYFVAISLWGFFLISVTDSLPWLRTAIKGFCAIYILWLAFKTWKRGKAAFETNARSLGFRDLFVATIANPKAVIFAGTLFPVEAFRSPGHFAEAMAVFIALVVPIGTIWSCLGHFVTSRKSGGDYASMFLRSASMVLVFFSGSLIYSIASH